MNLRIPYSSLFKTLLVGGVLFLLLTCFSFSASAQNTKGDRPAGNRENRFKITPKKGRQAGRVSSKRVKSRSDGYSPRGRARGGERAGKPIRPIWSEKNPSNRQKAWKGDISGRRIRHKNTSSVTPYVHPQPAFTRKRVRDREGRQNVTRGASVSRPRSVSGRIKNVYPQNGPYVNNPSRKPRDTQRAVSNRQVLARLRTLETPGKNKPPGRKVRVIPRSASRAYISHKSINVFARFKRPKKKPEQAHTGDIAGRRLRTKNYQTRGPGLYPAPNIYQGRKIVRGDRAYPQSSNSYSATRTGRPWRGDISGKRIRYRDSKKSGMPTLAGRVRSRTKTGRPGAPLVSKSFGLNTPGLNFKGRRPAGKTFNDQGEGFTGFLKFRRPLKGGGSRSGKFWNNGGRALEPRLAKTSIPGIPVKARPKGSFNPQGEGWQGALKYKRPLKGGGSRSGRLWNNGGRALEPRIPRNNANIGYAGNLKARKPLKGGGSISGRLWNNNEKPLVGRQPKQGEAASQYTGNIKVRRAQPGKDGKLPVRVPSPESIRAASFPGKQRLHKVLPDFKDQGEEFTGFIRLSRWKKNYIQNKRAAEESTKKKRPEKETYLVDGLQVKVKQRDYVRNKDLPDEALMKYKQTKTDQSVAGLQVRLKRRPYVRNKNASEDALYKLKPTKTDQQVADLQVKVRQYHYIRNPSSAEDALKVREPGRAFARSTDYQGNIKMQKFKLFERNRELHPDARFVRTNRNNVKEERDTMTNFKLWWARLFKKQETQPDHLKEKGKKPRYDKGEQGMWYD